MTEEEKRCRSNAWGRAYTARHPGRRSQTRKDYAKKNRDKLRVYNKAWASKNRSKISGYSFAHRLKKLYGLTIKQYEDMVNSQSGGCAICRRKVKLHVDHCHRTGHIRGLLCSECNLGLGKFRDNPGLLHRANVWVLYSGFKDEKNNNRMPKMS